MFSKHRVWYLRMCGPSLPPANIWPIDRLDFLMLIISLDPNLPFPVSRLFGRKIEESSIGNLNGNLILFVFEILTKTIRGSCYWHRFSRDTPPLSFPVFNITGYRCVNGALILTYEYTQEWLLTICERGDLVSGLFSVHASPRSRRIWRVDSVLCTARGQRLSPG